MTTTDQTAMFTVPATAGEPPNDPRADGVTFPGVTVRAAFCDRDELPTAVCLHIGDQDDLDVDVHLRREEALRLRDNIDRVIGLTDIA